jgi:hypothetical protein
VSEAVETSLIGMLELIRIRALVRRARFVRFSPQPSWTSPEDPLMQAASNQNRWKNQEPLAPATSSSARYGNGAIAIPYRRDDGARARGFSSRPQHGGQTPISRTGDCLSISQDELKQYQALSIEEKKIRARRDQLKESLVRRFQQGARVEPGRLKASLREQRSRYLTAKNLLPILGNDQVEYLKNQVEPAVSYTIKIDND